MLKAIAWGVGLAVLNVAAATVLSKAANSEAKEAETAFNKFKGE